MRFIDLIRRDGRRRLRRESDLPRATPWRARRRRAGAPRGPLVPVERRARSLGLVALAGLVVLLFRLFYLQILSHSEYAQRAAAQQERRVPIAAVRGDVVDREGRVLLHTLTRRTLVAEPKAIADRAALAKALAPILHRPAAELTRVLARRAPLVELDAEVDLEEAAALRRFTGPALRIEEAGRRVKLVEGCDLLGAINHDGIGDEGIERSMQEFLRGADGWETRFTKASGQIIPLPGGPAKPAVPGDRVVLTIDANVQWLVEDALRRAVADHTARGGSAVLVEVATGEVVALAAVGPSGPGAGRRANRLAPIEDTYEPGSTFKIVTFAAALDQQLVDDDSVFFAENGRAKLGPCVINDVKKMGWLCLADVIAQSSNIATAKIGLLVGARELHAAAERLGFGAPTHIELPGEVAGILRPVAAWSGRSTPTVAIGQEVAVTTLQLAMAYAAVAGGGELRRPRIVREVLKPDGEVRLRTEPEVVRRAMSPETAATLTRYLTLVVDAGTGKRAAIPGVAVAGKTGTAQKARTDGRGYAHGRYVSSFIGFFPATAPRYALAVSIDEPSGMHYGGEVAAPVFREIAAALLGPTHAPGGVRLVSAEPSPPAAPVEPEIAVPDVRLLVAPAAAAVLARAGLTAAVVSSGPRILTQEPAPGTRVPKNTVIQLGRRPEQRAVMPDLAGLSLREALGKLRGAGLEIRVAGIGRVEDQSPPPGTELVGGQVLKLRLDAAESAGPAPAGRRPGYEGGGAPLPAVMAAADLGRRVGAR